jgi:hypothetical protein
MYEIYTKAEKRDIKGPRDGLWIREAALRDPIIWCVHRVDTWRRRIVLHVCIVISCV